MKLPSAWVWLLVVVAGVTALPSRQQRNKQLQYSARVDDRQIVFDGGSVHRAVIGKTTVADLHLGRGQQCLHLLLDSGRSTVAVPAGSSDSYLQLSSGFYELRRASYQVQFRGDKTCRVVLQASLVTPDGYPAYLMGDWELTERP